MTMHATTRTTNSDEHGNPTSGSAEATERYDTAIDLLVRFHPDVVDHVASLVDDHPDFAMGHALAAHLHLMSTDPRDVGTAAEHARALAATHRGEREDAHATAIAAWLGGDWHGSARLLDELLLRWPADILALMIGHQLDFFTGDAHNLRGRIARSLDAVDHAHPHAGFVRGMLAFGLEEAGTYDHALEVGTAAVEANRDDVWAIHAVTHVHEMRGDVEAGVRFLDQRTDDWGSINLFTVHNWWHRALFALEQRDHDRVFAIYDDHVRPDADEPVAIDLVDASALLWRLHLDAAELGDRARVAADAWSSILDGESPWYVFNDVHAVLAHVAAGRLDAARAWVRRLASGAPGSNDRSGPTSTGASTGTSNDMMTAEVGLPACRALLAFGEERYDDVVDELWPRRRTFHRFGGSHAQRDVLERTLLEGTVRASRHELARRLVTERLTVRPTGRFALDRRERLLTADRAV